MRLAKPVTIIMLLVAAAGFAPLDAQTTETDRDTLLRALLEEIRALRQTLEKSQLFELRANIMLDQMQVRQNSIDKLRQRLSELRQQHSFDGSEEFEFYVDEVKQRLDRETDPAQRQQIERELEMIEKRREIQERRNGEVQQQIQQLELRLLEEEDKMVALESELDRLQRSLIDQTD